MSDRTLVELNHDYCPGNDAGYMSLGKCLADYMLSGSKKELPSGVTFVQMHHHTEPSVIESLQRELDAAKNHIAELQENLDGNQEGLDAANQRIAHLEGDKSALKMALESNTQECNHWAAQYAQEHEAREAAERKLAAQGDVLSDVISIIASFKRNKQLLIDALNKAAMPSAWLQAWDTKADRIAKALAQIDPPQSTPTEHDYTSTACIHDQHEDCRKSCRFCGAWCRCSCHAAQIEQPQQQLPGEDPAVTP